MSNISSNFVDEFSAGFDKLTEQIQGEVSMAGAAAMAYVYYEEARLNASRHIVTRKLYDSIYRVFVKERSTGKIKVYRTSWNKRKAPHGHLIEFGHKNAPAYPFIRPAFDRTQAAIEAGTNRMAEKMDELGGAKR